MIALAQAANVERWFVRRPTPEMIAHFGEQGLHPFIEQGKAKGEPVGVEVLAEDYSGNDDLREAHIDFIINSAQNVAELANYWLDNIPFCQAPCGHSSQYLFTEDGGKHIICLLCERQERAEEAYHQGIERDLNS